MRSAAPSRPVRARGLACRVAWLALPAVALGLGVLAQAQVEIPLTVAKGVPLEIALLHRVPISKPGVPVEGRLTRPVYAYDTTVIPAGSIVLGRVTRVKGISRMARTRAILNGSFTPWRKATVEFDTLVLANGKRIPISTLVAPGAAPVMELVSGGGKKAGSDPAAGLLAGEKARLEAQKNALVADLRMPHKGRWVKEKGKEWISAEIPYHRQAYQPGTVFTAELQAPLEFGMETIPAAELSAVGTPPPAGSIVHARLITPLDSATTRRGAPVEAAVTQPLFSSSHALILPQGSRLKGQVIEVKAARRFHRNGRLRFTFQHIDLPKGRPEIVHASVEGAEVARNSHLRLGAEGGLEPAPSKKKYLAPTLSLLLAVQAATPDRDAISANASGAVPGQGGAIGKVLAGGWGFGLIGSAVSLATRSRALTAALGFYGAAWSIYSNLLTRGQNVVFPANTPMELLLGSHTRAGHQMPLPTERENP